MEARKWEELPRSCLVDVLGRVGLESLLLYIPFVCKSWYQAILNPLCWKQLHFPSLNRDPPDCFIIRFESQYGLSQCDILKFVKGVVDRSAGCATYVNLPSCYGSEELSFIAVKCPALKTLVLHSSDMSTMSTLSSVMGEFKNLEVLHIWTVKCFKDIVTQVGAHCQNFTTLILETESVHIESTIGEDEVMTIVSCLPKLKSLTLNEVVLMRENLIKLLNGCVSLVHLDVRDCYGFFEDDKQLLKLASHIPTFKSSGSTVFSWDRYLAAIVSDSDDDDW